VGKTKIYVSNLASQATAADLTAAFGKFGTVTRAKVATDRETGRSRGLGFVEMSNGANEAIAALNGTQVEGQTVTVSASDPRVVDDPRGGQGKR